MEFRILLIIVVVIKKFTAEAQVTSANISETWKNFKGINLLESQLAVSNSTNFNNALNSLLTRADFQPLVLSIGNLGRRQKSHDLIAKYFLDRHLDHYEFDLDDMTDRSNDLPKRMTWIILVDNFVTLDTAISEKRRLFNSANSFIIFFIGDVVDEMNEEWINIFRKAWNRWRICKMVFLSINENFRYLHVYRPFAKTKAEYGALKKLDLMKKPCDNLHNEKFNAVTTLKIDDSCQNNDDESKNGNERLFENFGNLNDYPIPVTIFPSLLMDIKESENNSIILTKFDANVMRLVEKRMSAKFMINVLELSNETDRFVDSLRTIGDEGNAEFVFTGFFVKPYAMKFHFTASILEDKVCLIAPSSKPVPKYFMPLLPFANELWLLLIFYNIVIAALWLFMKHFESNIRVTTDPKIMIDRSSYANLSRNRGRVNDGNFRKMVRQHLWMRKVIWKRQDSYTEPPKIPSGIVRFFDLSILACSPLQGGKTCAEKAFLFGTLFFALIVIGLYQSYLVSSLSKPIYYPQLKTLKDVELSNRTIFTKYRNLVGNLLNDESREMEKLRKKIEIRKTNERTYDIIIRSGAVAFGRFSSFKLENLTDYQDPETSRMLLHIVEECLQMYSLAYVGRRSSPYLERVDSLLLRIQQAGLIEKWYEQELRTVKIVTSKTRLKRHGKRVKVTLEHLSLTFIGLIVGLTISSLVLIGECYFAVNFHSKTPRRIPKHNST